MEGDEDPYDALEAGWGQGSESDQALSEEESLALSDEEADYEAPIEDWYNEEADYGESLRGVTYSDSDFNDEYTTEIPEAEPPDHHSISISYTDPYANTQATTWSQPSSYEDEYESEEDSYEYHDCPKPVEKPNSYEVVSCHVPAKSRPAGPKKQANKRSGYCSTSLVFSRSSKNHEVYLSWADNMETWLQSNNIPKEKKLSQAVQAFTGKAYEWWLKENNPTIYKKPVLDWRDLKVRMHKEFVEKLHCQAAPRRVNSPPQPKPTHKHKYAYFSEPKKVSTKASSSQTKVKKTFPANGVQQQSITTFEWWQQFQKDYNIGDRKAEPRQNSKEEPMRREVTPKTTTPSSKAITKSPDPSTQGKSSNFVNSKEPACYKCHKRGHFAVSCSIKKRLKETSLEKKTESYRDSDSSFHCELLISNSRLMHLSFPKSFDPGIRQGEEKPLETLPSPARLAITISKRENSRSFGVQAIKEQLMLQLANTITVSLNISRPIPIVLNSDIMHLLLSLRVISGTKEIKYKDETPENNLLLDQVENKEVSPPKVNKTEVIKWIKTTKQRSHAPDQESGIILSYLLKGKPPDAQQQPHLRTNLNCIQGKPLNSKSRMKTNLLSLGAGDIVSRSKPFQEREYDEDIKSSSAKDHETRSHDAERMKLRRAKETCELSSAQMEAQAKYSGSTKTWRTYSTHLEFITKKNQPKRSPYEEDIEDTTWKTFNGPDGDRRSLNEVFQPNQEEPSNKSNCFGLSTHQVTASNWTQDQIHFGLRVIDVTNRVNRNFPDLDIGALIGASRSNQKDLSYKPTWSVILIQIGSSENWIYTKVGSDEKDIQFLSQRILDLPYLEPSEFGRLQTYLWRPGGNLNNLEASKSILSCTSIQRIRRILPHLYFPFPDKITLGAFKEFTQQLFDSGQRLYLCCCCVLEGLLIILDVPRHHTFTPKLSRLKHHHNLLYLADFLIKSPTALFSFIAAICLLILAYYHCARAPI